MTKARLLTYLLLAACGIATAQSPINTTGLQGYGTNHILSYATVQNGDTIPIIHLNTVTIATKWALLTNKEIRKNQKLIRNVKKTLPYAKEARRRLQELEKEMASLPPKKRSEYIKKVERELLDEFQEDLEKMTFSQGKVLLKLVDRETGNNSYTLVADLRGKFRASFYNTFARMFGFNMKERFDPQRNKEDNLLDRVARSVELGRL
ncbi:MAG: DUF4294 domain-containing protein [Bacteroidales bacterium]|nr:DUF4294 domain-containing protein [Bacteroidales bacterium]MCR5191965.1 DUF4294 domain-containing protein [Bacteroidales bacterium]